MTSRDLPGPLPRFGPRRIGDTYAVVDEWFTVAGVTDGRRSLTRQTMATGLAKFIERARCAPLLPSRWDQSAQRKSKTSFWPSTNNVRSPIREQDEIQWLRELATQALSAASSCTSENVNAHGDWRIDNIHIWGGRIRAIYDWDAVFAMDELAAVGTAAALHPLRWSPPSRDVATPGQVIDFVEIYGCCRRRRFTKAERTSISGHALWTLCTLARHQIADPFSFKSGVNTLNMLDQYFERYLQS